MQSTIDDFYRKRKLPCLYVNVSPSKKTARNLFPDLKATLKHDTLSKGSRALLFNQSKNKKNSQEVYLSSVHECQVKVARDIVKPITSTINLASKNIIKELAAPACNQTELKTQCGECSLSYTSLTTKNEFKHDEENTISTNWVHTEFNEERNQSTPPASTVTNAEFENNEVVSIPSMPGSRSKLKKDGELSKPVRSRASKNKLEKELGLGVHKKVVRQSKRYAILKEHVDKFNETLASFKDTEKSLNDLCCSPKLEKFHTVDFEITSPIKRGLLKPSRLFNAEASESPCKNSQYVSPSKLLAEGPVKSPIKTTFERYNHLIASKKDPLVLPQKYIVLKEMFHWMETIMKIRADRGELVTFKKIQPEMQRIIKKNFTEDHLGKIISIYPTAYRLSRQRVKSPMSRNEPFELIISKSEEDIDSYERQKIFYNLLLEKTRLHHRAFLETLDPPLDIPTEKIKRWHPEFEVDNVPDVEASPVPQPPDTEKITVPAKDFPEKTCEKISNNNPMKDSISAIINEKNKVEAEKSESVFSLTLRQSIPSFEIALKGISKSVLDKIRAKQAEKIAQTITRSPAETKKFAILSRLPELAKILRMVFVSEKRNILREEVVIERVSHSFKEKMSRKDVVEHLQIISNHVPCWMNFCIVRNISYIRLSKDADMTCILVKLKNLICDA